MNEKPLKNWIIVSVSYIFLTVLFIYVIYLFL
ncbi:hypothetical protein PBAC_08520 [Pedobacter glucosidilyticus]|nr:hypothetical protein PBAC_08520 [Pedobacter glucosidilyticus]